jgi:acetate---CoA ligase (ADP-forming)
MNMRETATPPPDPRLNALFDPGSIAIVGASGNRDSWMSRPLSNLLEHEFMGSIIPVNPNYEEIEGLRAYPSLPAIGEPVDLVLIAVPAAKVIDVIHDCGAVEAAVAIVFSSGFGETGLDGRALQDELKRSAHAAGIRVIGPNCMGAIHYPNSVVATFTPAAHGSTRDSGFAFVGQSGALGGSLLGIARESGLGMTAWVSTGNQADCGVVEAARALLERDEVRVIAMYLENLDDPAGFMELNRRATSLGKSIVCMAAGLTTAGWRAAVSHTGALVRPDASFRAAAERAGALVVDDLNELHDAAYSLLKDGRGAGRRVVAVSTSGGAGSLIADHLERSRLTVAAVPDELKERLSAHIPDFGSLENPVDVTAALFTRGQDSFGDVCGLIASDPAFDQVIVVITQVAGEQGKTLARQLVELIASTQTPIQLCWLAGRSYTQEARDILASGGVPVHDSIRGATLAAARIATPRPPELGQWPDEVDTRFAELPESVTEHRAAPILDAAGVPRPQGILVTEPQAAAQAVRELGGSAALKLQAPNAVHKTELGLVRLGVGEPEADQVTAELMAAAPDSDSEGVLIQELIRPGFELLVSVTRDAPGLPPVLTVGAGGPQTEVWADTASAPVPVSETEARDLLMRLRCAAILRGHRGRPAYDVPAAVDAVLAITRAASLLGARLRELEVNPLIVQNDSAGAYAADVLLRLNPKEES